MHSPTSPETTEPKDEQDARRNGDSDADSSTIRQSTTSAYATCESVRGVFRGTVGWHRGRDRNHLIQIEIIS
jgi:hypothetical protein